MTGNAMQLIESAKAWNSEAFESVLKREVATLGKTRLPLQQGLAHSSYALDDNLRIVLLDRSQRGRTARLRLGAFYSGIIAGCNCADDPSPPDEITEYCEMQIELDLDSGDACIALLED